MEEFPNNENTPTPENNKEIEELRLELQNKEGEYIEDIIKLKKLLGREGMDKEMEAVISLIRAAGNIIYQKMQSGEYPDGEDKVRRSILTATQYLGYDILDKNKLTDDERIEQMSDDEYAQILKNKNEDELTDEDRDWLKDHGIDFRDD